MRRTRRRAGPTSRRRWRSSTCWSSSTRIRTVAWRPCCHESAIRRGVYLLPAATQYETVGSVTASNRSLQWREKVFGPLLRGQVRPRDHVSASPRSSASTLGRCSSSIKVEGNEPVVEDIIARVQQGMWTIGYTGQSPERLKLHMANQHTFDKMTLKANGGPCDGDYYGLAVALLGHAGIKHPGRPTSTTRQAIADGGLQLPRQLGRRAQRRQERCSPKAGSYYRRAPRSGRPPASSPWPADEDRLGEGPDARTENEGGAKARTGRPTSPAASARRDQARHVPVRQRQGALRRLELPGPRADPPRAALQHASRPGAKYPTHADRKLQAPADAVQIDPGKGRRRQGSESYPIDPHLGPPGGIRGRRRGDALQPVARRTAAEHVRRDQPGGRQRPRHQDGQWVWVEGPEAAQAQGHGAW